MLININEPMEKLEGCTQGCELGQLESSPGVPRKLNTVITQLGNSTLMYTAGINKAMSTQKLI